jgi:lysophospholipase L1-like esterase
VPVDPVGRPIFSRYVALGDSGTEGVGDRPYPDGSERGWADRLAEIISVANPRLLYANLAVRGRRVAEVHQEQLAPAIELGPDLVTVVAGINDVIRPGADLDAALLHMDEMLDDLRSTGATVVTATFPDLSPINPLARLTRRRLHHFNSGLRAIAAGRGALLVEAEDFPILADRRMWCDDRLHLSPEGHRGLASATVKALGYLDGFDPAAVFSSDLVRRRRFLEELRWTHAFLLPWIRRRVTGRSSGDGRAAKRPRLEPPIPRAGR